MLAVTEFMRETLNGFRVEIPPKRRKLAVIFALDVAVLVGTIGIYLPNRQNYSTQVLFTITICLLIVAVSVFTLIGELFGKESIELDGFTLIVTEVIFGIKVTRRFEITLMKNITMGAASYWQGSTYVMSNGRIHFEYNDRTVSIGGTVDEDEAFDMIHRIRKQITPEKIGK